MVIPHVSGGRNHQDALPIPPIGRASAPEADTQMVALADQLGLQDESEVCVVAIAENEFTAFLGDAMNGAILDRPDGGIALPSLESFAVEQRYSGTGCLGECRVLSTEF